MQSRWRNYAACAIVAVCAARAAFGAVDVNSLPKPTGYVNDFANVVSAQDKAQLEEFCAQVERQLGVQFALVTVDSIGDQPIRDFALDLGRKWGVGSKQGNQGVVLLLAVKDHKNDIETGRGIEPYIPDGFAGGTLRSMRPQLRAGDYGAGLMSAAQAMAQQIAQGKGIAFNATLPQREPPAPAERHGSGIPGPLIILGIFLLLWLFSRGRRGGGGGGFWTGLLLGNLLGGGGGGNWGDRGGFGRGSGGGGGFGGFGGGDFGGGGASSDW